MLLGKGRGALMTAVKIATQSLSRLGLMGMERSLFLGGRSSLRRTL